MLSHDKISFCWHGLQLSQIKFPKTTWRLGLAAAAVTAVGVIAVKRFQSWMRGRALEKQRNVKRYKCRSAIEKLRVKVMTLGDDDNETQRITRLSLMELTDEISHHNLTSVQVLHAFQTKAIEAHDRTNCLVEPISEAETWAGERDSMADSDRGLLHGVPVSIKEYFSMQGYDATLGLIRYVDHPCAEDSVLIKVLKAQGAVPFVKTNMPHMGLSYTTRNPIFGITAHPTDQTRGPGGSSGGESALIALNGSPLGWGSDVGGSIRNPCHFCGLAGLKPTGNRISTKGTFTVDATNNCLPIVLGPMSRDVDGLVLAMKALLSTPMMFELDRSVPPLPFNDQVFCSTRRLRIGYYVSNGLFQPVPACQRAVHIAKDCLSQRNYTVTAWELPHEIADALSDLAIKGKLLFADKGDTMLDYLKDDEPFDNLADAMMLANMPIILRKMFAWSLKFVDKEMSDYVKYSCGIRSIAEWWKVIEQVTDLRKAFDAAWDAAQLDALICPAFCSPSMPVDQTLPMRGEGSDLQIFNVLDVPAGVVPVTTVTTADIDNMKDYPVFNNAYEAIKQGMIGAEGLPVGVQVVAQRWQEELCLRVMKEIETDIHLHNEY